tara:strand:+ start:201 stop:581 length:381 start_codon:yes stop_codon:yes gene_type:complete
MANPNIVNVATITGKLGQVEATDAANGVLLLANAAASGKVFNVKTIIAANIDGSSAADISIAIWDEDTNEGDELVKICNTVTVPADASLVVLDKNSSIYLEEDRSIYAKASANGDIDVLVSYEEIS